MGRRQSESNAGDLALVSVLVLGMISCCMVYSYLSTSETSTMSISSSSSSSSPSSSCCRGVDNLELWGEAVKWGSSFKLNSSQDCCLACKDMCPQHHNHTNMNTSCSCDSWVFCGNSQACGPRFGECWLKKQKNSLEPVRSVSSDHSMWTSGIILPKGEDVVGLETGHGILRIQLFHNCAPHSVAYILEILQLRPLGCQFYRSEARGGFWDSQGNHLENAPFGPPFGLIQGTLEDYGTTFRAIPPESSQPIQRGSVAWVGSGPDFFISLANHAEWKESYSVFGLVFPQDMDIAEKISQLPTKTETWGDITVSVLETPVPLRFKRVDNGRGDAKV